MKTTLSIPVLCLILGFSSLATAQHTFVDKGTSKELGGTTAEANASVELDQRTSTTLGTSVNSDGEVFTGAEATVGAGLYANADASHSATIGKTEVRNYTEAEAFVGAEAGAKAGVSNEGLEIGGSAFAGARVEGAVGTEVGPAGAKLKGEAWSGAGVEVGADAGFEDGKLTLGLEAGAAIGVGGKLGSEVSIDFKELGDTAKDVGGFAKDVGGKLVDGVNELKPLNPIQIGDLRPDMTLPIPTYPPVQMLNPLHQAKPINDFARQEIQNFHGNVQDFGNNFNQNVQQHSQNFRNGMQNFGNTVDQHAGQAKQTIANTYNGAKSTASNTLNKAKNSVSNGFNKAKNTASNTANKAKRSVNKAKKTLSKLNPFK